MRNTYNNLIKLGAALCNDIENFYISQCPSVTLKTREKLAQDYCEYANTVTKYIPNVVIDYKSTIQMLKYLCYAAVYSIDSIQEVIDIGTPNKVHKCLRMNSNASGYMKMLKVKYNVINSSTIEVKRADLHKSIKTKADMARNWVGRINAYYKYSI